jgi:hypothetical protein
MLPVSVAPIEIPRLVDVLSGVASSPGVTVPPPPPPLATASTAQAVVRLKVAPVET